MKPEMHMPFLWASELHGDYKKSQARRNQLSEDENNERNIIWDSGQQSKSRAEPQRGRQKTHFQEQERVADSECILHILPDLDYSMANMQ